uniref:Uncharacterized protein n=1 Tax=Lutzomyia longipalpis TaxID=7200 RepID=A0A1B0CT65_LUTLO
MQMTHIRELSFPIPPPNESQFFDRMVRRNVNNIRLNVQYRMHTDKEKDEDEEEDEDNEEDEKENYWAKVKTVLENKNAIGTGLPIKCEKHGSEIIAKSFGDFMDFTKKGCAVGKDLPQTSNHPCFDVVEDEN